MGFAHALAVLHALLQLPTLFASPSSNGLASTLALPFPHLQQRLQQSLPGVLIVVSTSVVFLYGVASLWPLQSVFVFPGVLSFVFFFSPVLVTLSLVHVLLRYVMVPGSSSSSSSLLVGGGKSNSAVYGWLQTSICVVVELTARIHQEPQLLVLLTLSLVHVWLMKSVAYWGFVTDEATSDVNAQFNAFAVVGGLVAFVSFVSLERRMGEDPFVLDRRSILEAVVVKDVVRALRRGLLVYVLARAVLFVTRSDDVPLFAFRFDRAAFQITTSVLDSFVLLGAASIFRVLLFRPNHSALHGAVVSGSVWDSLVAPRSGSQSIHDALFGGQLAVSSQSAAPLADQFVIALKRRMDNAVKKIADGTVRDFDAAYDQVEALEAQLQFTDLLLATKFDASTRRALFASEPQWRSFVRASTSLVDCFTLTLQLLNTIPERKNASQETEATAVEKSVSTLLALLSAKKQQHPLFVLDAHPHLSNLRISSTSFKSKIQYYFASRVQFAMRRFIVEEARRRVFVQLKAVHSCEQVLCHLVSASRCEDAQGNVQQTVPAVLSSLVECRNALEVYIDTSAKIGNAGDAYEREAKALARGIDQGIYRITDAFSKELASFSFAPSVKKTLESYIMFSRK